MSDLIRGHSSLIVFHGRSRLCLTNRQVAACIGGFLLCENCARQMGLIRDRVQLTQKPVTWMTAIQVLCSFTPCLHVARSLQTYRPLSNCKHSQKKSV